MKCQLTIFTPTYNRGQLLIRLFESLCKQTKKDFEWIIVDDDSSDDTEAIVSSFIKSKPEFEIRYYQQEHGGKHRACNKGAALAKGDFFFIVDSDDMLRDNAVELIFQWTAQIKDNRKMAGVSGLKISFSGKILGGNPKIEKNGWVDASNFERSKYHLWGDKAEVYRTELLRKHRFPEFAGEYFITEDVCWDTIAAKGYKIRWFQEPIYICDYLEGGLTKSGANSFLGHKNNYRGYCYYIAQCMKIKPKIEAVVNFREFNKTAKKLKKPLLERAKDLNCSFGYYCEYLFIIMPFFYGLRIIKKYLRK